MEAQCRSLFMGGVTRRFPELAFGLLEGGVSWACQLFADIVGHWEKRNREAIHHLDPARRLPQPIPGVCEAGTTPSSTQRRQKGS